MARVHEKNGKGPEKPARLSPKQRVLLNHMRMMRNEMTTMLDRAMLARGGPDPRRNLDQECGHPASVNVHDFWKAYRRDGIAARVVNIFPDECWSVDPDVYESEGSRLTPFEQSWMGVLDAVNLMHFMHRVDIVSGIGRYGGLLLGVNDGKALDQPIEGADLVDDGTTAEERRLLYLRVLDETQLTVSELGNDPRSPRYGLPTKYTVKMISHETISSGPGAQENIKDVEVHWSRIHHVADNRTTSEIYGQPRMEQTFNRLLDADKVLGSSAEMYYKGGFPGFSLELDPRLAEFMDIEIDDDSIEAEMFAYMNGLQRFIWLQGLNAKSLAPQVADPIPAVTALLNAIAMSIPAPLRIFMGSEQAQLASGQDIRTWNRRLTTRQKNYLTPLVIRTLVDRLIRIGVLRRPRSFNKQAGTWNYKVFWPDVNLPNDDERSQIADRQAAAMMKYVQSGAWQFMQFRDFLRFVMRFDAREVAAIMKNSKKTPEIKFKPPEPVQKAGDSGTRGKPPSKANPKPRPGGKK